MKGAVLYARASSERQAEKALSIPAQLRALRQYCSEQGYAVLREFVDEGRSGTTDQRPGFQEMVRFSKLNAERVSAVLVWKHNRFSRERVDAAFYKRLLRRHGVNVISITEPIAEGVDADIVEALVEAMDSRFSKSLAQDVMRGIAETARLGFYPLSMAPYGYRRTEVLDGRAKRTKLVPDEETAPVVERIFKTYVTRGLGAKEMAKLLNKEGLRTRRGKRWTTKAILRILRNPIYVGELRIDFTTANSTYLREGDRSIVLKEACQPLVDQATFNRAQRICQERARTHPRHLGSDYLLTGLLRCRECGQRLYGVPAKSSTCFYYACRSYLESGRAACGLRLINRDRLDGIVLEKVRDVLLEPRYLRTLIDEVNAELGSRKEALQSELHAVRSQIREREERVKRLLDALETGNLSTEEVRTRLEERRQELEELQARRLALEVDGSEGHLWLDARRVLPYVESLKETLATAPVKTRRFILKSFVKEIEIAPGELVIDFLIPQEAPDQASRGPVLGTVTSGTPERI